jgi:hypothetical protein
LILKFSFLCVLLSVNSFAISVLIAKESINFEEKIDSTKLIVQNVSDISKACIPLKLSDIQKQDYVTTHFINKNTIICQKDVKDYKDTGVIFNFGGVKIEKKGKIIYENDQFIRIKNLDGSIEQIYKDGRIK